MKIYNKVLFTIISILLSITAFSQEKLLVSGSGWTQVAIIDKQTAEIEWSYTLEKGTECNDTEITSEGNILMAYKKGAKLINKDQKGLFSFKMNNYVIDIDNNNRPDLLLKLFDSLSRNHNIDSFEIIEDDYVDPYYKNNV